MPLDENDQKTIADLISASLTAHAKEMQENFNRQLSGSNNRTWESLEKRLGNLNIDDKLKPVLDQIEKQNSKKKTTEKRQKAKTKQRK